MRFATHSLIISYQSTFFSIKKKFLLNFIKGRDYFICCSICDSEIGQFTKAMAVGRRQNNFVVYNIGNENLNQQLFTLKHVKKNPNLFYHRRRNPSFVVNYECGEISCQTCDFTIGLHFTALDDYSSFDGFFCHDIIFRPMS